MNGIAAVSEAFVKQTALKLPLEMQQSKWLIANKMLPTTNPHINDRIRIGFENANCRQDASFFEGWIIGKQLVAGTRPAELTGEARGHSQNRRGCCIRLTTNQVFFLESSFCGSTHILNACNPHIRWTAMQALPSFGFAGAC